MEIILGLNVTMNEITTKKCCFSSFGRFVTRGLNLRLQKMYIYLFQRQFLSHFLLVLEAISQLAVFWTKMYVQSKEQYFWHLHDLYSEITGTVLEILNRIEHSNS